MWIFSIALMAVASILAFSPSQAQIVDRAEIEVGAMGTSGSTLPFWLHANTSGVVDPSSSAGIFRGRIERTMSSRKNQTWTFGYGAEVTGRASNQETLFFPELYAEARYRILRARVGRKVETIGTVADSLTSGSMGTSRNATPMPKVLLRTDGYVDIPFTNEWIDFKGRYEHGWFSNDRFVNDAFLHQKSFYLRGGAPSPVQGQIGLVHKVMWGGTDPNSGRIPQGFDEYTRAVFARNGTDDSPAADSAFIQGNHFGIIDFGISTTLGPVQAHAYHQVLYDDEDNLILKDPQDGITGISLTDTRSKWWIDRVLYEFVYTKSQNGPGPDGNNYFNHSIYESGWTLHGRMAASPLLTPFPADSDRRGIENNRVVGHHLGVGGTIGPLDFRGFITYTRNFGTWKGLERARDQGQDFRFDPPLEQTSVFLETRFPWPSVPELEVMSAVGLDTGKLRDDSVGIKLSLTYRLL
jgi:hypothetical protein